MPRLVDTTIRLLSQEPLAGRVPTGELLRIAEVLDGAGFALLEVSGGGVFDTAVRRGVESPWERIRALKTRTSTPLGLALRGRFLVGARPVGADFVRRFVASAAENGIDVFRLHDPLNDVSNLREPGEAIVAAGKEFHAGLVYSPGDEGAMDKLVEQARELPEIKATRALVHDPSGGLEPHQAGELVGRVKEASGLPVGFYCQGAGGTALADSLEAARAGADMIACAVYPLALSLHRVAGESLASALAGMGLDTGVDVARLWEASDLVDEHIGDEIVTPHAPRIAVRAAEYDLPTGLVAALDTHLRAHAADDRLLETLDELQQIRRETGWPPLAAPIGQILASQALIHVLSARRYGTVVDEFRSLVQGGFGTPPGSVDATVARAVELLSDGLDPLADDPPTAEDVRQEAEGLAASEEELVLIALFGEEAEALLRTIRARHSRDDRGETTLEETREQRIRELVRIVQESGVAEVEIEDEGMRVSVRRADERPALQLAAPLAEDEPGELPVLPAAATGSIRVESPMVGVFYRQPEPGTPPFVEVGDVVTPGQTLCLLEAMKLFNELKADAAGRVTAVHAENGKPVEFGQLLFELEPIVAPPRSLMFSRVLVANRGEIAVRIIRAIHELGAEAVAVYSTADRDALHVRLADQAVCIGPPSASESYLRVANVIAAAGTTGCEAVHPGYGFLSENPAFVRACEDNDLVFVGPGADVMERMGDKARAKAEMKAAGVPLVPGTEGGATLAEVRVAAEELGFPVLLKATAGGGGKGMRLVHGPDELEAAYSTARVEAEAAFSDGSLYLEKALVPARHIEIQVLCDKDGGVLTLGERECSIQRRHQKLIEESPSAALDAETREEMEAAAERACRTIGYENAGTFEFLLGADGTFHFIELNARLQVEHPVSELVTGVDLVREQLRVAAGEPLSLTGRAPRRGHALEIRLNAEDPARDFAPAPGTITRFRPPLGPGVRIDTHLEEGSAISPYYDSLIAKLVVWAEDRPAAISRGIRALEEISPGGRPDHARARAGHPPLGRVRRRRVLDELPGGDGGAPPGAHGGMSRDAHVIKSAHGEVRIEGDALAALVIAAAERVDGARARRPRRGLDVDVADGKVEVELELAAQYGTVLPELARAVQQSVTDALRTSAGLTVERVDVSVEELDP